MNKRKIFNDPVYGFVTIPYDIIYDLIEHPFFQRMRRIKQLGLTDYVYPGALHTRFSHALGALHLMTQAIDVLRSKGADITEDEAEAVTIAILLHDIGHGPHSHALEKYLVTGATHEHLSRVMMDRLNEEFNGRLELAIRIFRNEYHKTFLNQLVASQLDVDRLDYLNRDSFFTGVNEGVIGYDRIIKMMDVQEGRLVIEAKGIYSIEKFIIARRLMYWQVYLHKTVLGVEQLLSKIISRAKALAEQGVALEGTPALKYFLANRFNADDFKPYSKMLDQFAKLDDTDVMAAIKSWTHSSDKVLAILASKIVDRHLLHVTLHSEPFSQNKLEAYKEQAVNYYNISYQDADALVFTGSTSNSAYSTTGSKINILYKDGRVQDIADASDQLNISVLAKPVVKYFLCVPKVLCRQYEEVK
jgi:HD superfamily phosphohydrolase